MTLDNLIGIAKQFTPHGRVIDIREFGNGNINATFLVTMDTEGQEHFILQRINTGVFPQPELVMRNLHIATDHIRRRRQKLPSVAGRRWETPGVLLTGDGRDHWIGPNGSFWRAITFIDGARSFDRIKDGDHAREVGSALGIFHALLSDLPSGRLTDTLEGFHITPLYLRRFEDVIAKFNPGKSSEVDYCLRFVSDRKGLAHVLEDAKRRGELCLRPIHGDPKVDNIMIDTVSGQAVGIVDLDTIKPGLIHYDIGDCLRSACNPLGEEIEQWERVNFDLGLCNAVLQGYVSTAKEVLIGNDFFYIYDSVRLIAFELGLRFFTDYLEGDVYFKIKRRGHNLARALVQFKLTESIEAQEKAIRSIIRDAG